MITDVPGVRVGHATDEQLFTGCTVLLCPEGTIGSGEVRGPSPGSRETALLGIDMHVEDVTAVLLTGGSAFGLAAADGVMRYCEEHGLGHWTPMLNVPIVPAAVVFDMFFSQGARRPDAEMGYAACLAATDGEFAQGNVGAGAGVTVGKWAGFENIMKGGLGSASQSVELDDGTLVVGALAVTNCVGDVLNPDRSVLAGAYDEQGRWRAEGDMTVFLREEPEIPEGTNTTLVVVATNASLNKVETHRLAQQAHNGLALAVNPSHTTHDGDTAFSLATGTVEARFELVAHLAVETVAEAIRESVRHAASVGPIRGLADD